MTDHVTGGTVESSVSFPRWWVERIRDGLMQMGNLPPGPLGDWAFLFREILSDKLAREPAIPAQQTLPSLVDRSELVAVLEDLASVNLSREACERQARRMADDLIARGLSFPSLAPAQQTRELPRDLPADVIAAVVGGGITSEHITKVWGLIRAALELRDMKGSALPSTLLGTPEDRTDGR